MSLILLNRLPIPNLKHYCTLSISLFLIVILYGQKVLFSIKNDDYYNEQFNSTYLQANGYVYTFTTALANEPWCIWVMINCCYCALLLFSKLLQKMIFGNLRVVEYQHIKDHFWNFIFLKFIFIFGVLNLESANEVGMWCTWFSIIGFLAIHAQICKDRFEYLSFSSATPLWNHIKVIALLNCIICLCMGLIGISILVQLNVGFNIGLFMFTEAFALTTKTLYVIVKYGIHLWDIYYVNQWDNKGTVTYYVDFVFEMTIIIIDFFHYIHMLLYGNFFLSMASIVICMELRRLFYDVKKRLKRHANYLRVIEKMEKRFPWATKEELGEPDKCAVCWEKLDKARKLPCTHMFHHNCLRSWLEQDTSCPTCRTSLQDEKELQQHQHLLQQQQQQQAQQQQQPQQQQVQQPQQQGANQDQIQPQVQQNGLFFRRRNFFHFDGSRYISWLPSFSVEVTHNLGNNLPSFLRQNIDETQLNAMAQQVIQVFPHIPLASIIEDLRQTHSVEITINNILQDRLNSANAGVFDTDSDDSEGSTDNTDEVDLSANLHQNPSVNPNELSSFLNDNQNSSVVNGSETFKTLFNRKRELLENSKKRYLSKVQETSDNNNSKNECASSNDEATSSSILTRRNVNN